MGGGVVLRWDASRGKRVASWKSRVVQGTSAESRQDKHDGMQGVSREGHGQSKRGTRKGTRGLAQAGSDLARSRSGGSRALMVDVPCMGCTVRGMWDAQCPGVQRDGDAGPCRGTTRVVPWDSGCAGDGDAGPCHGSRMAFMDRRAQMDVKPWTWT